MIDDLTKCIQKKPAFFASRNDNHDDQIIFGVIYKSWIIRSEQRQPSVRSASHDFKIKVIQYSLIFKLFNCLICVLVNVT